jgi:hypothetical protein
MERDGDQEKCEGREYADAHGEILLFQFVVGVTDRPVGFREARIVAPAGRHDGRSSGFACSQQAVIQLV